LYQGIWSQFERPAAALVIRQTISGFIVAPFFVYFVFLARAIIFTTLEKVRPARPHSYRPTIRNDLVAVAAYSWIVFPLASSVNRLAPISLSLPLGVESVPIPIRIALYLVAADFGYYWMHRLMHTRHVWRVHMWHHSPPFIYWLAGMRATVPQQVLVNIPYVLVYPLVDSSAWWIQIAIAMHVGFKNDWQHMNVAWRSHWLEWIFVTPRYHQIHHSADPRHYVANLGDLLTVWDRLFGTYVDPAKVRETLSFGIDSTPHPVRLVLGV